MRLSRWYNLWVTVRTGLWLVPAIMAVSGVGLALLMLQVELPSSGENTVNRWWLYSGEHENARDLISTIFSSMITMTTLVVSITMVVLTLAATQLGPRLVRIFMGDFRTQFIFGLFLMTVIYCLLVLRALDSNLEDHETPHVAVTVGALLALINLFALLFFIHNLARSIVSDTVVQWVDRDLRHAISRLMVREEQDELNERTCREALSPVEHEGAGATVWLKGEGYVQTIDYARLVEAAKKHDVVLRVDFRAGHFLIGGCGRAEVYPGERMTDTLAREIECVVLVGEERTPTQDVEYSIRQLVEVGVRALSPGINDPYTAIAVIDRLGAALRELMRREPEPDVYRDEGGQIRVYARSPTFFGFVDIAFHQIRQAGAAQPAILIQILHIIRSLGACAKARAHKEVLNRHAELVVDAGRHHVSQRYDQEVIEECFKKAMIALSGEVAQQ